MFTLTTVKAPLYACSAATTFTIVGRRSESIRKSVASVSVESGHDEEMVTLRDPSPNLSPSPSPKGVAQIAR